MAFTSLVDPYRGELHAHCYRMLGSVYDADDALQDTLLRAWRGLAGFQGRSSLRSWLYTIATIIDRSQRLGARVLLAPREGPAGWRSVVATPAAGEVAFWQPKR